MKPLYEDRWHVPDAGQQGGLLWLIGAVGIPIIFIIALIAFI